MEQRLLRRMLLCVLVGGIFASVCVPAEGKKPKGGADPAANGEGTPTNGSAGTAIPSDLNMASLRVSALDTLYQLDVSAEQLNALAAAEGMASTGARTATKGNEQLSDLFSKMQGAILAGNDDAQVATVRNQIIEFVNSNNIELDDAVHTTAAAHAAAVGLVGKLKASQIAAYVAMHADDVSDPVEALMGALTTLREAKSNPDMVDETLAPQTCEKVGYLVAGMDEAKAKGVAEQAAAWLKAGVAMGDEDFAGHRSDLEAEAKKIVGSVGPMEVLTHWVEQQVAVLLSNPEEGEAVRLMLANRKAAN